MSDSFETTIEREEEMAVTVTYSYSKGCRGTRDSLGGVRGAGPPLEPDEPPSVDIMRVIASDGADYESDLTENERKRIEIECLEREADKYADAMEAREERRRDRWTCSGS